MLQQSSTHMRIPLPREEVFGRDDQIAQLVDALHFLHSQRVLHRDLKPANIFVKRGGHGIVKLGDFGIAKVLGSDQQAATIVGQSVNFLTLCRPCYTLLVKAIMHCSCQLSQA